MTVLLLLVKYNFGYMPKLSKYAEIIRKVYFCCDISEKNGLILLIFGTIINHNMGLMHVKYTLALCQNIALMFMISYIVYASSDIS